MVEANFMRILSTIDQLLGSTSLVDSILQQPTSHGHGRHIQPGDKRPTRIISLQ